MENECNAGNGPKARASIEYKSAKTYTGKIYDTQHTAEHDICRKHKQMQYEPQIRWYVCVKETKNQVIGRETLLQMWHNNFRGRSTKMGEM